MFAQQMSSIFLPVTAIYLSLASVLIIFLALRVVKFRRGEKIGIGSGGNKDLEVASRAHANAVENIPLAFLLLAVLELNGALWWSLHVLGALLVLARLMHAWGFTQAKGGYSQGRFFGTALTWILVLVMAGFNLVLVVMGGK